MQDETGWLGFLATWCIRAVLGLALWFLLFYVLPVAIVWLSGGPK
jgi:hypothetical protein